MSSGGRLLIGLAVGAVLLAPASAATNGNGLYGVVRKGPITPVCRVEVQCDVPARVTLVFSRLGRAVARVCSKGTGRYRIALAPGLYGVRSVEKIGIARVPTPHAVHVRAGHWDRIDFRFDTGIR
jgi:hypothetical protein